MIEFAKWMFINMSVAVALSFLAAYPPRFSRRWDNNRAPWSDAMAFCLMSVFCLLFPWTTGPGVQVDLRYTPLIMAGWIHGWFAAVAVAVVIVVVRTLVGGAGVVAGITLTLYCVALVPFLRKHPRSWQWLSVAGAATAGGMYVIVQTLTLPRSHYLDPLSPYWLLIIVFFVLSFWLLNAALEHVQDKRRLQESLAVELQSKEAVLRLIPYGVVFLDEHQHVTGANEAAASILMEDRIPEWLLREPHVASALQNRTPLNHHRVSRPGLHPTDVLVSAVPTDSGGSVLGLENVTGLIQHEREEARRTRLELLGRLAATAAHEIKNPLTTIKGFVQLFALRPELASHRSSLQLVQGEVEHINRVVNDFLELSAHPVLQPILFPLDQLLGEILSAMDLQFPEHRVRVTWAGEQGLLVRADYKALKQILKNLVMNAYEAMASSGELQVRRQWVSEGLVIAVTDSGPGIPDDVLPHIFTPYLTTKATGTGLGLSISHKLAEDMGGQLKVELTGPAGSTFRLLLPATTAATPDAHQS